MMAYPDPPSVVPTPWNGMPPEESAQKITIEFWFRRERNTITVSGPSNLFRTWNIGSGFGFDFYIPGCIRINLPLNLTTPGTPTYLDRDQCFTQVCDSALETLRWHHVLFITRENDSMPQIYLDGALGMGWDARDDHHCECPGDVHSSSRFCALNAKETVFAPAASPHFPVLFGAPQLNQTFGAVGHFGVFDAPTRTRLGPEYAAPLPEVDGGTYTYALTSETGFFLGRPSVYVTCDDRTHTLVNSPVARVWLGAWSGPPYQSSPDAFHLALITGWGLSKKGQESLSRIYPLHQRPAFRRVPSYLAKGWEWMHANRRSLGALNADFFLVDPAVESGGDRPSEAFLARWMNAAPPPPPRCVPDASFSDDLTAKAEIKLIFNLDPSNYPPQSVQEQALLLQVIGEVSDLMPHVDSSRLDAAVIPDADLARANPPAMVIQLDIYPAGDGPAGSTTVAAENVTALNTARAVASQLRDMLASPTDSIFGDNLWYLQDRDPEVTILQRCPDGLYLPICSATHLIAPAMYGVFAFVAAAEAIIVLVRCAMPETKTRGAMTSYIAIVIGVVACNFLALILLALEEQLVAVGVAFVGAAFWLLSNGAFATIRDNEWTGGHCCGSRATVVKLAGRSNTDGGLPPTSLDDSSAPSQPWGDSSNDTPFRRAGFVKREESDESGAKTTSFPQEEEGEKGEPEKEDVVVSRRRLAAGGPPASAETLPDGFDSNGSLRSARPVSKTLGLGEWELERKAGPSRGDALFCMWMSQHQCAYVMMQVLSVLAGPVVMMLLCSRFAGLEVFTARFSTDRKYPHSIINRLWYEAGVTLFVFIIPMIVSLSLRVAHVEAGPSPGWPIAVALALDLLILVYALVSALFARMDNSLARLRELVSRRSQAHLSELQSPLMSRSDDVSVVPRGVGLRVPLPGGDSLDTDEGALAVAVPAPSASRQVRPVFAATSPPELIRLRGDREDRRLSPPRDRGRQEQEPAPPRPHPERFDALESIEKLDERPVAPPAVDADDPNRDGEERYGIHARRGRLRRFHNEDQKDEGGGGGGGGGEGGEEEPTRSPARDRLRRFAAEASESGDDVRVVQESTEQSPSLPFSPGRAPSAPFDSWAQESGRQRDDDVQRAVLEVNAIESGGGLHGSGAEGVLSGGESQPSAPPAETPAPRPVDPRRTLEGVLDLDSIG